jgi:hypothetical protein
VQLTLVISDEEQEKKRNERENEQREERWALTGNHLRKISCNDPVV